MSLRQLSSHKQAATKYHFDNGAVLSVVFGPMTYSDNHDDWDLHPKRHTEYSSTTVEIMALEPTQFCDWFERKYEYNPAAYIPVAELPLLLMEADGWRPPETLPNSDGAKLATDTDVKPFFQYKEEPPHAN